ncbi:hypothetical protein [Nocardia concava]|uniref:hypothetical protein n=1 Tax=Nocardia concava TaxID=257281 RepID=UPI0003178354|nr:hypothetical protein [Nocardia concava]
MTLLDNVIRPGCPRGRLVPEPGTDHIPESAARQHRSAGPGARLVRVLDAVVRLGGPIWFERPLITELDVLAHNPAERAG